MTIDELKRALVEVRKICRNNLSCWNCGFRKGYDSCPLARIDNAGNPFMPEDWEFDGWEEDSNETD